MAVDYTPLYLPHGDLYIGVIFLFDGAYLLATSHGSSHGEGSSNEPMRTVHTEARAIVWDTTTWNEQARFQDDYFNDIALFSQSPLIATSNYDQVKLWDLTTGQRERTILDREVSEGHLHGLTISPNEKLLAVCCYEGSRGKDVLLVDIENGDVIRTLQKEDDDRSVMWVQFLPDGKRLAGLSYEYDSTDRVYIWDVATGKKLTTFDLCDGDDGDGDDNGFVKLALSPTGRYVVRKGSTAHVWELETEPEYTWRFHHAYAGHREGVWQHRFSLDERLLVTMGPETLEKKSEGGLFFSVYVWDVASGEALVKYMHHGRCFCMCISPNGRLLATMSGDVKSVWNDDATEYILTLWEVPSGDLLASLPTESKKTNMLCQYPTSMTFSPNGQWLAVGHLKHVEVWDIEALLMT